MTSLLSPTSHHHFKTSNSTFKISFFTPTKLRSKPNPLHLNSINSSSSSSLSKLIFSPKLRHQFTNFVFFLAFSSSCLCVGFKSCFPNSRFHSNSSNSNSNSNQTHPSSSSSFNFFSLSSFWKPFNQIDSHHLPIYQNSNHSEQTILKQKQRRWIEEH
ncbi:hypothetical protein DFH28DRAFT_297210 [Melampsora americana]|nr:hypothetical protein DFH28DRAFT_297210 [Melampsora americana]